MIDKTLWSNSGLFCGVQLVKKSNQIFLSGCLLIRFLFCHQLATSLNPLP